jgi:hypothetical protein
MFRTCRRSVGTFATLVILAPSIAGCSSTQHIPFDRTVALDHVTGVSTRSGRQISFSMPGASVTNDTMYAVGRTGQVIIPTDSIAAVSKYKFSAVRTAGLVVGIAAGAFAVFLIALAHSGFSFAR